MYDYYIINTTMYIAMRRRINKGTLVGSTNPLRRIVSKRLVVEVLYNFRHGIVKEKTIDVRSSIEQ